MLLYIIKAIPMNQRLTSVIVTRCQTLCSSSTPSKRFPLKPTDKVEIAKIDKKDLQWRKPWFDKEDEWYSSFRLFAPETNPSIDVLRVMTNPIDLRPATVKKWWKRKKLRQEKFEQSFIQERFDILGNDLAAAHFIVHRGGAIRFAGELDWRKKDEEDEYSLPATYQPNFIVTAIDCSSMKIHYEGLANLRRLPKLTWLSFKDCQYFDDWCLDRICGEFGNTLQHLDISGCSKVSERGLVALYKTINIKTLIVSDMLRSKSFELTCLMLEELYPKLTIISVKSI